MHHAEYYVHVTSGMCMATPGLVHTHTHTHIYKVRISTYNCIMWHTTGRDQYYGYIGDDSPGPERSRQFQQRTSPSSADPTKATRKGCHLTYIRVARVGEWGGGGGPWLPGASCDKYGLKALYHDGYIYTCVNVMCHINLIRSPMYKYM